MLLHNRKEWFKAVLNHDLANVEESLSVYKKSRDGGGETALMAAARTNDAAMVKLLVHEESRMTSPEGHTALMMAAARDFYEVCAILGPYEADVRASDGRTALMIAAISGSTEAMKAIIQESEVDRDNAGLTALEHAVLNSELEAVKLLCTHLKHTQEDFHSAISKATQAGDEDTVRYLQSALADLLDQQMKPKVRFSADVESPEGRFSADRCANCKMYRGQISALQEEVSTLRHENKRLSAKVEMLDTQLQETQKYDKEHQASLTNKCNSLEDELNKMHEKYRVSLEENSRIKLELAKSDSTYERRKDADTIEQLQQRLSNKSHECASLREQLTELQQQRERERHREQDWAHDSEPRYENVMTKGPGGNASGYNIFKYEFDVDKDSLMPSLLPPHSASGAKRPARSASTTVDTRNAQGGRASSASQPSRTSSVRASSSRMSDSRTPEASRRPTSAAKRETSTPTLAPGMRAGSTRPSKSAVRGANGTPTIGTNVSPGIAGRSSSQRPRTSSVVSSRRNSNNTGPRMGTSSMSLSNLHPEGKSESVMSGTMPSPIRKKGTLGNITRFMTHMDTTIALDARGKHQPPQIQSGQKTELMIAAESNDIVSVWHRMNTQAGMRDHNGTTALMYAVQAGNSAVARVLAEKEGGIQRHDGSTALMDAACIGNVDCVRALLSREAGMQRYDGWTALMTASSNNKPDIVQLLVDREAGLCTNNRFTAGAGLTALMAASIEGHLEIVHLLVHMENSMRHSSGKSAADFAKNDAILNLLKRF